METLRRLKSFKLLTKVLVNRPPVKGDVKGEPIRDEDTAVTMAAKVK